jgi:hypothetical protein
MQCQAPIAVKTALDRIWKHDYVLPTILREFAPKPEQIYKLFDSVMKKTTPQGTRWTAS